MILPNYSQGSIVNLVSSILHGLGASSPYTPLPDLVTQIKDADTVILLVLDGMGMDSMQELGKKSFFNQHYAQSLTSVFPSATTAAVTTLMTGVAPQEHGFISWDMNMKEFGSVVQVLPYRTKRKEPLKEKEIKVVASVFDKLKKIKTHLVIKKSLLKSPYNTLFCTKAEQHGFNNLSGMLRALRNIANVQNNQTITSAKSELYTKVLSSNIKHFKYIAHTHSQKKQYIYTYWGGFDDFSHAYGKTHPKTKAHLRLLERAMIHLAQGLEGTNTLLLVTADHGQIVTTPAKTIVLNKHPKLLECLSVAPCGEPRAIVCYVHPHKVQQFEEYVKYKLKHYCTLHQSKELVRKNYFGLGKAHPHLFDRIGDYILLPTENYVFRYFLPGEKPKSFKPGHHGGLSEEEMKVPLVMVKK